MATLREKLDKFINHPVVDGVVMVLITVSVVLTIAEFTRDTHPHDALWIANEILTVVFIVELSIRYYVARSKRRFFEYAPPIAG